MQAIQLGLADNLQAMQDLFHGDNDFVMRRFALPDGRDAGIVFIDGLADANPIGELLMKPLLNGSDITIGECGTAESIEQAAEAIMNGDTALFVDGYATAVFVNTKGFPGRSVEEPQTETVIRGPREGFTENFRVNTALIRKKLKTTHLRMESVTVGKRTNTLICLCWLDDVAQNSLIEEVRKRLKTIDVDAILSDGYVEEYIEDAPRSIFQTIGYTEKPDVAASKLLDGRCALIVDGSSFVLTMPMLFAENFHSPEDYSIRPYFATFLRILRTAAFFLSLTAPAIYVALVNFHQEVIPTALLYTISAATEDTPFSSPLETAVMLFTFEVLREAGVRLPKPTGQAVSTVGALVMGQAAIEAGIVGAPVVIVIALSAVAGYVTPTVSDPLSLIRWLFLILASILGGFGLMLGGLVLLTHLGSLESFGAPYLHPIAPMSPGDLSDTIVRMPLWFLKKRPSIIHPKPTNRKNVKEPKFSGGVRGSGSEI
ncbi:MAG: spore germination protein [Oscillospiraceae bacterium]|jgi:spore germination protein KA|nr:spore germination protein [Oscillospiraceae bacterium]